VAATKALSDKDMNGRKVIGLGDGTANDHAVTKLQLDTGVTTAESRANHTGSQLASTVSDFDAQVRSSRLDQMSAPTGPVAFGGQRTTGQADPTGAQDGATKAYVDAKVAALSGGLVFKGAARVAATANVTIAGPGANVDGVAMVAGDVFLATAQTTGTENGPWVWNGAAVAATRPANFDTAGEAVPGSMWIVSQGTYDNQLAILSNNAFVLGTDTATFAFLNPAAAADNDASYSETCPVTAGGAAWAVNHGLGTKLVHVSVWRSASPYDEIRDVSITRDTTSQVNVRPDVALANGEFTVLVSKVV
jgi:hypothetical protein